MFKKILALGMVIGMANAVTPQVEFDNWDKKGQSLFNRIAQSQSMPAQSTIDEIKVKLPSLRGGAFTIYQGLISAWETGSEIYDYVPDELANLAEKIYSALLSDTLSDQAIPHQE